VLRAARVRDLDALLALERECFRTDRLTRVDLANALRARRARLLVVATRAGLAAYLLLQLPDARGIARIDSLGVARAARGAGHGPALVARAEHHARRAGATRLRLEVRASNRAARRLYASRGYRSVAVLPRYYADGGPGLRLERRLER